MIQILWGGNTPFLNHLHQGPPIFEAVYTEDETLGPTGRYYGSAGMADSTECRTDRETMKTADENMYENKKQYKEKHGSCR